MPRHVPDAGQPGGSYPAGRPSLPNRWVDTCALARRLLRDEVPNCQLGTLAERLRLPHRPAHRALADALATGDCSTPSPVAPLPRFEPVKVGAR